MRNDVVILVRFMEEVSTVKFTHLYYIVIAINIVEIGTDHVEPGFNVRDLMFESIPRIVIIDVDIERAVISIFKNKVKKIVVRFGVIVHNLVDKYSALF